LGRRVTGETGIPQTDPQSSWATRKLRRAAIIRSSHSSATQGRQEGPGQRNKLPQRRCHESRHRGKPPTQPQSTGARGGGGGQRRIQPPGTPRPAGAQGGGRQERVQFRELRQRTYARSGYKPPRWGATTRHAGWGQGNSRGQPARKPTPTAGSRWHHPRRNKQRRHARCQKQRHQGNGRGGPRHGGEGRGGTNQNRRRTTRAPPHAPRPRRGNCREAPSHPQSSGRRHHRTRTRMAKQG